ncbi:MAG: glycine/betaine ABC transporter [Desulfitibacter sp. BRH_c19]|nr:MAG: glycine/betaine ABC transporter [Desulfitibacter sp. BRH_c19]
MDPLGYFLNNTERIATYAQIHFKVVLIVTVISLLLWIPVGVLITRNERLAQVALNIANLLMCIPSIALFAIFVTIPFFGLGMRSAATALVMYAMLPLLRNVYKGVKSVDKSIIEAGRGMGMPSWRLFWEIELPLALPVIFAGIRISVVLTTGITTVATFIGVQTLGRLIQLGISRSNMDMIIVGALIVAVISLAIDFILGRIERKLISPGLRVNS